LKTDALPGIAAVVVVARHPAHARVVSAEFGERGCAGNGIRDVIVAAVGMRDGVAANRGTPGSLVRFVPKTGVSS
jgi:hypothetical protein